MLQYVRRKRRRLVLCSSWYPLILVTLHLPYLIPAGSLHCCPWCLAVVFDNIYNSTDAVEAKRTKMIIMSLPLIKEIATACYQEKYMNIQFGEGEGGGWGWGFMAVFFSLRNTILLLIRCTPIFQNRHKSCLNWQKSLKRCPLTKRCVPVNNQKITVNFLFSRIHYLNKSH